MAPRPRQHPKIQRGSGGGITSHTPTPGYSDASGHGHDQSPPTCPPLSYANQVPEYQNPNIYPSPSAQGYLPTLSGTPAGVLTRPHPSSGHGEYSHDATAAVGQYLTYGPQSPPQNHGPANPPPPPPPPPPPGGNPGLESVMVGRAERRALAHRPGEPLPGAGFALVIGSEVGGRRGKHKKEERHSEHDSSSLSADSGGASYTPSLASSHSRQNRGSDWVHDGSVDERKDGL